MADHAPAVGDPILVRSGRWIVNVARPIKDENGQIRAVLTVGPVLDHFQDTLRLHGLPPGSAISIINAKGIVIAANGGDWIGRTADWRSAAGAHRRQGRQRHIALETPRQCGARERLCDGAPGPVAGDGRGADRHRLRGAWPTGSNGAP